MRVDRVVEQPQRRAARCCGSARNESARRTASRCGASSVEPRLDAERDALADLAAPRARRSPSAVQHALIGPAAEARDQRRARRRETARRAPPRPSRGGARPRATPPRLQPSNGTSGSTASISALRAVALARPSPPHLGRAGAEIDRIARALLVEDEQAADRSCAADRECRRDGRIHAAPRGHESRRRRARSARPRASTRDSGCASQRGTAPRSPGTERQPSQPSSRSSPMGSITGLTSAVSSSGHVALGAGGALRRHLEDDEAQRHMHLRRGKPGAADIRQRLAHIGDQPARSRAMSGRRSRRRRRAAPGGPCGRS